MLSDSRKAKKLYPNFPCMRDSALPPPDGGGGFAVGKAGGRERVKPKQKPKKPRKEGFLMKIAQLTKNPMGGGKDPPCWVY